jgi:hypothetical protein
MAAARMRERVKEREGVIGKKVGVRSGKVGVRSVKCEK